MQVPCRPIRVALWDGPTDHGPLPLLWMTDFAIEIEISIVTQCRILCSISSSGRRGPFHTATTVDQNRIRAGTRTAFD
jgi:hypothetical protein